MVCNPLCCAPIIITQRWIRWNLYYTKTSLKLIPPHGTRSSNKASPIHLSRVMNISANGGRLLVVANGNKPNWFWYLQWRMANWSALLRCSSRNMKVDPRCCWSAASRSPIIWIWSSANRSWRASWRNCWIFSFLHLAIAGLSWIGITSLIPLQRARRFRMNLPDAAGNITQRSTVPHRASHWTDRSRNISRALIRSNVTRSAARCAERRSLIWMSALWS